MSLKELVKVADYYDVKYGFNKEAQTAQEQADYMAGATSEQVNRQPAAWQYAKDMAKSYVAPPANMSSKVPAKKPPVNQQAPNLQKQLADVAKKVVEKLPAGVRPQLPSTSN